MSRAKNLAIRIVSVLLDTIIFAIPYLEEKIIDVILGGDEKDDSTEKVDGTDIDSGN